ncbi:flavin reductase family protein [Agromyces mangrovi Wang et al. 2018]|uniref:flavin reductase family protein n=1 Tax=Agromyces mangrovi TaxID=1858653 RepID=UPI00257464F7|nr:flavin reductase family protein [Agromyces mangrovi]BDZ64152.1 monooxygenase [Agromyces mangrovi]
MSMDIAPGTTFDPRAFRDTLGHYASGITVISGMTDGAPTGFTCQSFYSVSMEPPLVSFSVMTTSTTYPAIRDAGRFAVNVLAHDQDAVSSQFARRGTDKWAGIDWTPSGAGNPLIAGSLMWLDCDLWAEHEAGDHYIVIGRVNAMSPAEWHTREPLLFYKGTYRHLRGMEQ